MATIIFSTAKRYRSKLFSLIKFLSHNREHVALGFTRDKNKYVFHLTFKGAIITPIEKFMKYNVIFKEFEIIPPVPLNSFIEQRMGEFYGKLSGWITLSNLCFPFVMSLLSLLKIKPAYNCANFARQVDDGSIKSWSHIDFNWATSEQLLAACETSNEFRIQ